MPVKSQTAIANSIPKDRDAGSLNFRFPKGRRRAETLSGATVEIEISGPGVDNLPTAFSPDLRLVRRLLLPQGCRRGKKQSAAGRAVPDKRSLNRNPGWSQVGLIKAK